MTDKASSALKRGLDFATESGLYWLLAALVIVFAFISNSFLSLGNWMEISIVACFLLTVAAGLTVVMIAGAIDLSVGSVAYLAATAAYLTIELSPAASIATVLAVGLACGLITGFLVAYLRMNSLLTTLGLMIAYRGLSLIVTGGTVRQVSDTLGELGRMRLLGTLPLIFLVSLGVMIVLQIVLSQTRFGAYCYAVGNSEAAAVKIGIPVKAVKMIAFCISGVCAAMGGLLSAMYLGQVTTFTGRGMEFQAVASVVIGGTSLFGGKGSIIPGTFAGCMLLIILNNGLGTRGVSPYVYPFIAGAVIFIAIYLDSLKNRKRTAFASD